MIAHIDVDAFFASTLVRKNPSLAGKPLLALGMGGGCVIAASYEAKAKGVKTGMTLKDALVLIPDAIRIPSDFHEAALASREIEAILNNECPAIEQYSIDEWFLDVRTITGGVPKNLTAWALYVQKKIQTMTSLSVSIGVGPSKLLAKMASEYKKPNGVTVLGESIERKEFLRDRAAGAIPGIGHRRNIHAVREGWHTALDIAQAPDAMLRKHFGRPGIDLKRELQGEELSSVVTEADPPKSVSRCRSFRPTNDRDVIWAHLLRHLEYTVLKMRRDALMCRGISVWVRDQEYEHEGKNFSLPQPLQTVADLLPYVRKCFTPLARKKRTYTQVALALWNLVPAGTPQYSLFDEPQKTERDEAIQKSLDILHERFGRSAITRGGAMAVKTGTKVTIDLSVY